VQVVDGVAGSDEDLYGDYKDDNVIQRTVQPFIASHDLNKVGFGVLRVER
jgi:hypothetical protein